MTTETLLNDRHLMLLEQGRGLDGELLARLSISASDKLGPDTIAIPYFVGGQRVNTKYRTISGDKKFCQEAGSKKCFWNHDAITDSTLAHLPLVITEGELDAISAIQAGFVRTVSVPDGAPSEEQGAEDAGKKYSYVADAKHALRDVREIILATDNDGPGIALMNDLAIRLGKHRCRWVKYPKGCKDLNDALMRYGERGVVESINRAQWCKVDGIYRLSELPPLPNPQPMSTGIVGMDRHYRIRPGDFCVVTGIPSHGKSSLVNEITARMAQQYGWSTVVASFEQRPQVDHRRNLRTFYNRKLEVWQTPEQMSEADGWINKHFLFMVPDEDDDVDLAWVIARAQAAIVQYGCKIVVIDPYNEMDHIRPPDMSLTEYTGFAIKQFRKLARVYQVHVILVAHPTKLHPGKAGEKIPPPTLYDISDSAHWFNKADIGIVVHRVDESKTLIRIAKSRYHDIIGKPGDLEAMWLKDQSRYEILDYERGYDLRTGEVG